MLARFKGITTARQVRIWPFYAVFICFVAVFIRFPGEWDADTESQHAQMLAGEYRDWHPPMFAAFWRLVNGGWNALTGTSYTGSGVLYVVHALMLWGGMALLIRAASSFFDSFTGKEQWKLLAVSSILLFFGLFEMVPMTRFIFKDTALMAAYILALGIMLNMPRRRLPRWLGCIACILLLFYGTGVRHNAVFALVPMLVLLLLKARPGIKFWALTPACLILWAGILFSINFVNYEVLKAQREYSLQEIVYVDFWRLNYETDTFDLPPLPAGQSWEPLTKDIFFRFYNDKNIYINSSFKYIREYYGGKNSIQLRYDFSQDPGSFERLQTAWFDKVTRQFAAYINIHKKTFVNLLREFSFMGLTGAWYLAAGLLLCIAGLVSLIKRKKATDPSLYLVTLSALLYILPYMVATPAFQRRYLFWFFFGSFFGICWLTGEYAMKRNPKTVCG